ncbi:MAG: TRAP transporter large permease subunit [Bacteriovoracaceae bacterium]|jgi:tripartite ATP-independent transporter DctM subunit|nr:TRAP transporter large permease subunit [Bacteriovoracaceae bacterium]
MQSLGILTLLTSALAGIPLFIILGGISIILFYGVQIDLSAIAIEMYRLAGSPTLISIPLFTVSGFMLAESKAPSRILNVVTCMFGWIPGGVAIVSLVVCAFFTAFTGASGVTIIALGGLIYPMLVNNNYSQKFSLGLITSSGSLGLLFPPSLPLVLYGIIAKVDIEKLFLAGIIPGFVLIIFLSVYSVFSQKKVETKKYIFSLKALFQAIKVAKYEIPLPLIVFGGIFGGFITVTEASAITALYVFITTIFIHKDLSLRTDLVRITRESMILVGAIILILSCALGLTNYLVDEEIPMQVVELMSRYIDNKYEFLFYLNIFLLIVGSLMDIFSAIVIIVPIILPIATQFDIDPIHLAIIFLTNLEIGYITPPVGMNLFISSFRFQKSIFYLYRSSLPFLFIMLVALGVITYFPFLSLLWFE